MATGLGRPEPFARQWELRYNVPCREGEQSRRLNNIIVTDQVQLTLLRTLIIWSLSTSESISQTIKDSYKQSRHEDDLNQPLSVQPWGIDGDKRRYWLIEGQDDTSFRLYRENAKTQQEQTWWNLAGTIDEAKAIAGKLENKDITQAARRLSSRIMSAIPRFEATEEVSHIALVQSS